MRYLVLLLLIVSLAALTAPPKKVVKSKALIACEARSALALDSSDRLAAKYAQLEAKNAELQKKYTDAIVVMRMLDAETGGKAMTDQES